MIKNLTKKRPSNFQLLKSCRPNTSCQGSFLARTYSGPQDPGQETYLQVSNTRVLSIASKHGRIRPVGGHSILYNRRPYTGISLLTESWPTFWWPILSIPLDLLIVFDQVFDYLFGTSLLDDLFDSPVHPCHLTSSSRLQTCPGSC